MGYSDPGPSPRTARRIARELAELVDRADIDGPLVLVGASSGGFSVRIFASDYGERVAGLVLVDASHEEQAHDIPRMAWFVPFLSSVGILRLAGMSLGQSPDSLAPSVREFARATRFRAAGYRAAADELRHIKESSAEVKGARRRLMIPVVVVMGARGADTTWRDLQRDQVGLSEHGCQIVAAQSGHVVPIEQPQVVVGAIRAIVDTARGRNDVQLCGSTAGKS
jgi:pimeloyl-ACP methyl ester carboxylesterase